MTADEIQEALINEFGATPMEARKLVEKHNGLVMELVNIEGCVPRCVADAIMCKEFDE